MTGSSTSAQPSGQQAAGVALEDQQGMIHVLVVGTVEEAELLMTIGGVVGGIHIEEDLFRVVGLVDHRRCTNQSSKASCRQDDLASRGCVLPSAHGGL